MRLSRIGKMVKSVEKLVLLVESFFIGMGSAMWVFCLLGLALYVFAVLATELFGDSPGLQVDLAVIPDACPSLTLAQCIPDPAPSLTLTRPSGGPHQALWQ